MNFNETRDLFLEEAQELLAKIENALLQLEKRPDDRELVNEVFRALHTIKGSGGMFGFTHVSEFTHLVENLFDEVRKGKLKISPAIIDVGLRSADCIAGLLDNPEGSAEQQRIIMDIERIGKAEAGRSPDSGQAASDSDTGANEEAGTSLDPSPPEAGTLNAEEAVSQASSTLPKAWRITFKPQAQILHRGVRLESMFRELGDMGIYHAVAVTDGLPELELLDPTAMYLSWVITLSTSGSLASIQSVFMFVEDYAELEIVPIELDNGEGEAATPKLGQILVKRGLLAEHEVDSIRQAQRPFGEVAVASGKIRKEQLEAALAEQTIVRTTNTERETRQESATIRVRKEKLDQLIDLVGELVILQAILEQEAKKDSEAAFNAISENLARLAADLRDTTMSIRMVPLEESFASFQRLLRDLSQQVGKELQLTISGASTELDKNVIEALKDPLVHIIRNSADHGIELPEVRAKSGKPRVGTISLSARQVGPRVEITIADDGAGLNLERIKARAIERRLIDPQETDENRIMSMIFEPGFSTAEKTTGLSGRGVGMDVVKRNIERLRGEVSLKSAAGKGMAIILSIPLTLVIIEGLLVRINDFVYVITLAQVQECVDLTPEIRAGANDEGIINLRGKTIPVIPLRESLGVPATFDGISRLVIVNAEGNQIALMVDAVIGRKQVVIKPLSNTIRRIKAISGATILGDGSVALILDTAEIIKNRMGDEA